MVRRMNKIPISAVLSIGAPPAQMASGRSSGVPSDDLDERPLLHAKSSIFHTGSQPGRTSDRRVSMTDMDLDEVKGKKFHEAFQIFDADGNGTVTAEELIAILVRPTDSSNPLTLEEAKWLITKFDKDGDGMLNTSEFSAAFSRLHPVGPPTSASSMADALEPTAKRDLLKKKSLQEMLKVKGANEEQVRKAFQVFDRDGNGTLSADELRSLLTWQPRHGTGLPLTHEEAKVLIDQFDKNGDGLMQLEEFITAFRTVAPLTRFSSVGDSIPSTGKSSQRSVVETVGGVTSSLGAVVGAPLEKVGGVAWKMGSSMTNLLSSKPGTYY